MRNALTMSGLIMAILLLGTTAWAQGETAEGPADHEQQCRMNLKTLGEAARVYLMLNRGKFPKKISELYTEGLVAELSVFVCPASGKTILSADTIDKLTDYEVADKLAEPPIRLFRGKYGYHSGKALAFYSNRTYKLISAPKAPEPPEPAEPTVPSENETTRLSGDDAERPEPTSDTSRAATPRDRSPALPPVSAVPDIPDIGDAPAFPQPGDRSSTPAVPDRRPPANTETPRPTQPANAADQARSDQLVEQGHDLWKAGKFTRAAEAYRKAIKLAPNDATAHNGLGGALAKQNDWAGAEAEFRVASKLAPTNYVYAAHVAISLLKQNKDLEEAERFITRAIKLNDQESDLHYQHGSVLRFQQRWAEAEAAYRRAIKLDPKKANYHADMVWTLIAQNKMAEARKSVARAKELGLGNHAVYAKVKPGGERIATPPPPLPPEGRTPGPDMTPFAKLLWGGQDAAALKEIRRLSALHPNHAQVGVSHGLMELIHQQTKTATAIADRLLKQYPDHVNVIVLRGQAAYWSRDADKARKMFAKAMQTNPDTAAIYFQQGTEFYNRRLWIMAYHQFITVTQLGGPGAVDAQYWLGTTCEQLGDARQAITWYQAYIQTNPSSSWAANARAAIERLQSASR